MKQVIAPLLLLLMYTTGFSQNLNYEIRGAYKHAIKKEKLYNAKIMSDIIPYYPSRWISSYISLEVSANFEGKKMVALSISEILSPEQINIIQKADLGTEVVITIKYNTKNPVTNDFDVNTMNYAVTIVPDTEAAYVGGNEAMNDYIKEYAINKIPENNSRSFRSIVIKFTVNEQGDVTNAQLSGTSGDTQIDNLLLDAINKMPKWNSAENHNHIKVKQDFEFSIGISGC